MVAGELSCAWVRAWASSRESSLVDGEQTKRDLGLDKVSLPASQSANDAIQD